MFFFEDHLCVCVFLKMIGRGKIFVDFVVMFKGAKKWCNTGI